MPVALSKTVLVSPRRFASSFMRPAKASSVPAMRLGKSDARVVVADCTIMPCMSTSTGTREPDFDEAARALRAPGVLADGDHVVELQRAGAQRVEGDEARHELGQARADRRERRRPSLGEHLAALLIDEDVGRTASTVGGVGAARRLPGRDQRGTNGKATNTKRMRCGLSSLVLS